jgi:hypothetical protein
MVQGSPHPALYWPADEVGSQTPGRLRHGDTSLVDYNSCHYLSICSGRNPSMSLSCTPNLVVVLN